MEPLDEIKSADSADTSLGKMLKASRERLGLSVLDVANQTKLAVRQIEALEADELQHLPELPFVRGFVRSYAKILHLEPQTLLAFLPPANADQASLSLTSVEVPFSGAHTPQRQNLIWLGAALVLSVLVVVIAVWNITVPPNKTPKPETTPAKLEAAATLPVETPITVAESAIVAASVVKFSEAVQALPAVAAATQLPSPVVPSSPIKLQIAQHLPTPIGQQPMATSSVTQIPIAQPPLTKPQPLSNTQPLPISQPIITKPSPLPLAKSAVQSASEVSKLRLIFAEASWTEIKDKDGKILSSGSNPRGAELQVNGQGPFSMIIGRAASVQLYHRGKLVDLAPYINATSEVARLTLE